MFWRRKKRDEPDGPPPLTPEQLARREELLQEAHRLGDEGEWDAAADALRDALDELPGDSHVLCWLGVAERELGMDGVAYERFKACLAGRPDDAAVLATAGNAVAAFDDPAAEPALRTATLLAPDLALARWLYGAYLSREGLMDLALEQLHTARTLEPENAEITYELAVALALQNNVEGAVDELYRAAELDPEDGWTRIVLGLSLVEDRRLDEAVVELTEGARARSGDVEAQLLAALAAAAQGLDDLAWEMLERGRQRGAGADLALADEVEERIEEGAESAARFLRSEVGPSAYRERLGQRP
ncbi:MAG TPA: tetratricopeptide repeat protein [Longimicrobiales bacterium]|jgi:predicted Zn-dependent protease